MSKSSLKIEKVVYGGKGLGEKDRKKIFIKGSFTGDEVSYEEMKDHGSYAEGKLLKLIKKSPHRQPSPCLYSEECGGCQWLDIKEGEQLKAKENFVKESFERIGRTKLEKNVPITKSVQNLHYRNRILLRGTFSEQKVKVGFFKSDSHEQIHIDKCMIAHKAHNELISYLNLQTLRPTRKQKFRLEVQVSEFLYEKGEPCLLITLIPIERNHALAPLLRALESYPETFSVSYQHKQKEASFSVFEEEGKLRYYTKPGIFQQINTETNRLLRQKVKKLVKVLNPQNILDLYCGSGNLSLGLTSEKRTILGVEFDKNSILVANHNVKMNKLKNIEYRAGNVKKFLANYTKENTQTPDCIIIDPPRRGIKEDLESILALKAHNIIYISCDPSTAARDFKTLSSSYNLKSIEGFDFFPQTYHIESLLLLERK